MTNLETFGNPKTRQKYEEQNNKEYFCNFCDYNARKKSNYERHILTQKHLNNEKMKRRQFCQKKEAERGRRRQKNELLNVCKICDYIAVDNYNLERHFRTDRHKDAQKSIEEIKRREKLKDENQQIVNSNTKVYICEECDKEYKSKSGLYKHRKVCSMKSFESSTKKIMMEMLQTNKELQNIIINQNQKLEQQNEQLIKIANKPSTQFNNSNNCNNTTYIENYLNVECKDAINLTDFIKQLQITMNDLLYLSDNGFTKSVKRLMIDSFVNMEQTKRPIHCTNKRKRTLYVKDKDKWEQDKEHKKIKHSITKLHNKELSYFTEYTDENTEEYIHDDAKFRERNNIIIGLTSCNKDNTVKDIVKEASKSLYLSKNQSQS